MNVLLSFKIGAGWLHPDPRHLQSRIHGKARILVYEMSDKVVLTVKPHYVEYVKQYVLEYIAGRGVEVLEIQETEATEYEHATVYERRG